MLYEDGYCRRGQAENHIKSWKTHLAADRTSCTKASANQLRLFLHAGAYWLMWGLRVSMPKRSIWRVAQFDTLRLRLIKVAARVVEMKTHDQDSPRRRRAPPRIFCRTFVLGHIPALSSPKRRAQRPECRASPVNPQTFSTPHSGSCRRGCGASASKQNREQSRLRAGVRGVTVKALHNGG